MKKEELLEAVGFVSEDLLQQTEIKYHTGRRTIGKLILIAATVAGLAVSVAAASKLFVKQGASRPIGKVAVLENETIASFEMDAEGNILLGGVEGVKIAMEVELDKVPPAYLEKIYNLGLEGE